MELTELVRKAQGGDQEAMSQLYQQTCQRVYALALRLTSDPDRAMDAVQESYLSALQNLDKLQKPEAFLHWMFQITANCCRKFHNREKRYVSPEQDEEENSYFDSIPDPDEKLLPEAAADSGETRRLVMELVDRLPQEQRECVVLYYFSECSVEEISRLQACTENTVKSRLNYARKKLKEGVLALEARDGIRLHSFAPIGLLLACTGEELPASAAFLHAWQNVAAGLGTAGAAAASTAAAAASAGEAAGTGAAAAAGGQAAGTGAAAAASGGHTAAGAAVKGVAGALKMKIAAGVAAGVVLAGGAGIALSQSPAVTFADPAFEQNIRVLLDIPEGTIREDDLEEIYAFTIGDDEMGIFSSVGEETDLGSVNSLEDLALFSNLSWVSIRLNDRDDAYLNDLLGTIGENPFLTDLMIIGETSQAPEVNDLSFLDGLPNLRSLEIGIASETDLTPLEERTSLMDLTVCLHGKTMDEQGRPLDIRGDVLDISKLTELRRLHLYDMSDIQNTVVLTTELPHMTMLEVDRWDNFPGAMELVSKMPGLEYISTCTVESQDLSPLAQLTQLRGVDITVFQAPLDLTPLSQCPALEMCRINEFEGGSIVPSGLPVETENGDSIWNIRDEIQNDIDSEIRSAD